jgi:hypothetical protein
MNCLVLNNSKPRSQWAALVSELHRNRQRGDQLDCLANQRTALRELSSPTASLDKFHGEVRPAGKFAHVVDLHDVRVPERRYRLGFVPEVSQC